MTIAATQQELGNYLEAFSAFEKSAAGARLPWLRDLRARAFARFCEVGFPTVHTEDWRFTNIAPIVNTKFRLAPNRSEAVSPAQIERYTIPESACRLVF